MSNAGLAASLGYGAASEMLRRSTTSQDQTGGSLMLTEANVKRLVTKLSKMRGAALKLGQFMSIQGDLSRQLSYMRTNVHVIYPSLASRSGPDISTSTRWRALYAGLANGGITN
jgi:hypothetical protein